MLDLTKIGYAKLKNVSSNGWYASVCQARRTVCAVQEARSICADSFDCHQHGEREQSDASIRFDNHDLRCRTLTSCLRSKSIVASTFARMRVRKPEELQDVVC